MPELAIVEMLATLGPAAIVGVLCILLGHRLANKAAVPHFERLEREIERLWDFINRGKN